MPNDSNLNKRPVISFAGVSKIYAVEEGEAIHDVTFSVADGEFLCIIGPSGSGKSTILKIIAGIEKETSGKVSRPDAVAMTFQAGALFPWLNVYDNVAIGLRAKGQSGNAVHREVTHYIAMMGLSELSQKFPAQLSGGQRQRVGIARALAVNPSVLLLDEPFSALDAKTTAELHDDIIKIWRETKKTTIMVSHLIGEAVSLAERIILIKNGTVDSEFSVTLPYPRIEQGADYMREVMKIRKEFFK